MHPIASLSRLGNTSILLFYDFFFFIFRKLSPSPGVKSGSRRPSLRRGGENRLPRQLALSTTLTTFSLQFSSMKACKRFVQCSNSGLLLLFFFFFFCFVFFLFCLKNLKFSKFPVESLKRLRNVARLQAGVKVFCKSNCAKVLMVVWIHHFLNILER